METPAEPASPLELLYLTRAHNQGEISSEEWLEQARAWAEAIIRQYEQAQLELATRG